MGPLSVSNRATGPVGCAKLRCAKDPEQQYSGLVDLSFAALAVVVVLGMAIPAAFSFVSVSTPRDEATPQTATIAATCAQSRAWPQQ